MRVNSYITGFGFLIITVIVVGIIISFMADTYSSVEVGEQRQETLLSRSGTSLQNYASSGSATRLNQTWLDFDGSDDVQSLNSNSLTIGTSDYTIMATFNRASNPSGSEFLIAKDGDGGSDDWDLYMDSTGALVSRIANTATVSAGNFGNNNWNHVTFRADRDSTTGGRIYLNSIQSGSSVNIASLSSNNLNDTDNLFIGERRTGNNFNGSLDEIRIYKRLLDTEHITALYNSSLRGSNQGAIIPVINYHHINDTLWAEDNGITTNVTSFTENMNYLANNGFTSLTFEDYYSIRQGTMTLPKKPIIIIFDDGYKDVYNNAYPIMDSLGLKGVIGIINEEVGTSGFMTWDDLIVLKNDGWGMSSHFINDSRATDFSPTYLKTLMEESRNNISAELGLTPISFIYPGNEHNDTTDIICSQVFTLCTGDAGSQNTPKYTFLNSNLTNNGILRISFYNNTIQETFENDVDFYKNLSLYLKFNENQGTTAYDVSGNGNNGTITGATWNNDGVLISLNSAIVLVSGYTYQVLDPIYYYTQMVITYTFEQSDSTIDSLRGNFSLGIGNISEQIPEILLIAIIVILLIILALLFKEVLEMGVNNAPL